MCKACVSIWVTLQYNYAEYTIQYNYTYTMSASFVYLTYKSITLTVCDVVALRRGISTVDNWIKYVQYWKTKFVKIFTWKLYILCK